MMTSCGASMKHEYMICFSSYIFVSYQLLLYTLFVRTHALYIYVCNTAAILAQANKVLVGLQNPPALTFVSKRGGAVCTKRVAIDCCAGQV